MTRPILHASFSRRVEAIASGLAVAALLLTVLIAARLSSHGGAPPQVLASAPSIAPVATTVTSPTAPVCDVGPGTGGLQLRGGCTGTLAAPFACVSAVDDLYVTGRHPLDSAHVLYVTVNIESYRQHPGDYGGAQAVLQVTGPVSVARWSNYAVNVHVNSDGSVAVPATELASDPGTGSSGTVTVSGTIRCAA